MSEKALFNAIGILILLALIGLLWVWMRFDERRDEKNDNKTRRKQ